MVLKLAIKPGREGSFVLIGPTKILYSKKIPYMVEEKKILYGQFAAIFEEIKTIVTQLNETIRVYIMCGSFVNEPAFSTNIRHICQGFIQGLLMSQDIKFKNIEQKTISQKIKQPYRQENKNRKLQMILEYDREFIDMEKDKANKYIISDMLFLVSDEE